MCSQRLAARHCGLSAESLRVSSLGGPGLRPQIAQFRRGCTIVCLASLLVLNVVSLQVGLRLLEAFRYTVKTLTSHQVSAHASNDAPSAAVQPCPVLGAAQQCMLVS